MSPAAMADKLLAIIRRDALTSVRHRSAFVVQGVSVVVELAGFYFLARAIGPGFRPDGLAYFPFLLIGTAVYTFLITGVNAFVSAVQEAQVTGTMEVVMNTATPAPVILLLSAFSAFASRGVTMVVYLIGGAMLYRSAFHVHWPAALLIVLLSVTVAVAIGMLAASVQLAVQKGGAVIWLFGTLGWLLTGTAFPVSSLPPVLNTISALIPVTYSIQGLRVALLQGGSAPEMLRPLAALVISVAVLLPLSLGIFAFVGRQARLRGTLSFY